MKLKVYNCLCALLLFTGTITAAGQITPIEPRQVEPLPPLAMTDTLKSLDFSKMKLKMDKLNHIDWNKHTLAMQKSFKKLQKNMEGMSQSMAERFNKDFNYNYNYNYNYNFDDSKSSQDEGYQKVKNYSKSYTADANDQLYLTNVYGNITINTWAKNEVKVDVQIKATASSEAAAQAGIDMVNIEDNKEGNQISFKTNMSPGGNSRNWNNSDHHKVSINYVVYMPAKLQLEVKNTYGTITLPDLGGEVKIRSAYTNVNAQKLSNPASEIASSYGNVKVALFNGGKISMAYGDISIGEASNLRANVSYGSMNLSRPRGNLHLNLAYVGNLKIAEVDDALKTLNINSSYSDLNLGLSNRSSFDFDVIVTNADFKFDDSKVNITNRTPEPGSRGYNPTKTYRGTFGKGNPDARVTITSSYGSVKFD